MLSLYEFIHHSIDKDSTMLVTSIAYAQPHFHDDLEIFYVLDGSIKMYIETECCILHAGDIAVIDSGKIHRVEPNTTGKMNVVLMMWMMPELLGKTYMERTTQAGFWGGSGLTGEKRIALNQMVFFMRNAMGEVQKQNEGWAYRYRANIIQIAGLLDTHFSHPAVEDRVVQSRGRERMKNILAYIAEHHADPLTAEDLAAHFFISPSRLAGILKEHTGISLCEYMRVTRLTYVVADLVNTEDRITDIFSRHGFSNAKTFNRVFLEELGCSPTSYRKQMYMLRDHPEQSMTPVGQYLQIDKRIEDFEEAAASFMEEPKTTPHATYAETIVIDTSQQGVVCPNPLAMVLSAGRAHEALYASWRDHLKLVLSRMPNFTHIRFHGLFCDDMGVVTRKNNGALQFSFIFVDNVFDFILSCGLHPFLELGFMPQAMASGEQTAFVWRGNITPPKNMVEWEHLITAFMQHVVERYGREEVRRWYFEVWNEPDLVSFWSGTFEDYLQLYEHSVKALHSVDDQLYVGGPVASSLWYAHDDYVRKFLSAANGRHLHVDFVSAHPYPDNYVQVGGHTMENPISMQELCQRIAGLRQTIEASDYPHAKLFLTEYNLSSDCRNLLHDTAFMGPFLMHSYAATLNTCDALVYWTFTDLMEENGMSPSVFHGGFGLVNALGFRKASYFAMEAICQMRGQLLSRSECHVAMRDGDTVIIAVWHQPPFSLPYSMGERSMLTLYDRYHAFESAAPFSIKIEVLWGTDVVCEATETVLSREHGSTYDRWLQLGAQESLSMEKRRILEYECCPKVTVQRFKKNSKTELFCELPAHTLILWQLRGNSKN